MLEGSRCSRMANSVRWRLGGNAQKAAATEAHVEVGDVQGTSVVRETRRWPQVACRAKRRHSEMST